MDKPAQKWVILTLIDDLSEGSEFYIADNPLHVTLAGVFTINHDGDWLVSELCKILSGQKPFSITADEKAMFGPNKDIPVIKIVKTPEIIRLHNKLYKWLIDAGAVFDEPNYQGGNYIPHCTVQNSISLKTGETRKISTVSFIDMLPGGKADYRKVLKTIELTK